MDWLNRLIGRTSGGDRVRLQGDGAYDCEVVGESHYIVNFEAICGPRTEDGVQLLVEAELVLDDANEYDSKAVRVEIQGKPVGYLSREYARAYRAALKSLGHPRARAVCRAQIRGGWRRQTGRGERQGHYGVWLDIPVQV